jgi:hypothetical protein
MKVERFTVVRTNGWGKYEVALYEKRVSDVYTDEDGQTHYIPGYCEAVMVARGYETRQAAEAAVMQYKGKQYFVA